jgi:2-dehydro-3-deoxygalactonokinase
MSLSAQISWVAVDWGTSHLRVWLMDSANTVLAGRQSTDGMSRLATNEYGDALYRLVPELDGRKQIPVICCGMVGSRQGWAEAPYAQAPCKPPGIDAATCLQDGALNVRILPGVKQMSPPDVMRGEETQIAGFLEAHSGFDGVICLPGTHSKWVHISAGEIVSFRTFMTGEMFDLLGRQSVLRHSIAEDGWDADAFESALSDALSRPGDIAARLFSLRAAQLVGDQSPQTARAKLSGLLVGIELASARPYWLGQPIAIIGADALAQIYADALIAQGGSVTRVSGLDITLQGLCAAYSQIKENTE